MKKWQTWEKKLPTKVNIPRKTNLGQKVLEMIDIHVFGDANLLAKCTVAYAATPGKLQKNGPKNFKKM